MSRIHSFPPVVSDASRVLILGTMPGIVSLKAGEYYAHPRNAFWPIMGELFGAGPALPYVERVERVRSAGIALWDSLQACVRPGSMDKSITDEVANDFRSFFARYPNISQVFFNGSKSEAVFRRHALPTLTGDGRIYTRLPSTSPAHAARTLESKVQAWSVVRQALSAGAAGVARPRRSGFQRAGKGGKNLGHQ
jgi:hypoxanthine-DNA glycosylase